MRYRFLRFPGGKAKAVTFSYDDGDRGDIRLAETINKYGIKCTFNINSGFIAKEPGQKNCQKKKYKNIFWMQGMRLQFTGKYIAHLERFDRLSS